MASLSNFVCIFPSPGPSKKHPPKQDLRRHSVANINKYSVKTPSNVNQHKITQNWIVKSGAAEQTANENEIKLEPNQGVIFHGVKYRQTYVIRSTEVGPNKTTTFESILNLLQETGLNHIAMMEIFADEYGATHEMITSNIIWVVLRMQVEVDYYPKWGEKVHVETWLAPSTKNSIQRESLVRSSATGEILARANSTWVLMNRSTRRLSKMSETLRCEISPWLVDNPTLLLMNDKIEKLDLNGAQYSISNLKPKSSDLDANYHVNNVKYIRWIFEAIPDFVLETCQLSSIVVEYRKESGVSDTINSLSKHYEDGVLKDAFDEEKLSYTHLLQIREEIQTTEILRGRTTWKKKNFSSNTLDYVEKKTT